MQGGALQVAKKRGKEYPESFRAMALERLKSCGSVTGLASELGVHRRLLYKWRDQVSGASGEPGENSRESELERENARLKQLLAERSLEVDFFKGALQQVKVRLQPVIGSGAKASTPRSEG
jgi:transposase-like protein